MRYMQEEGWNLIKELITPELRQLNYGWVTDFITQCDYIYDEICEGRCGLVAFYVGVILASESIDDAVRLCDQEPLTDKEWSVLVRVFRDLVAECNEAE